MHVFFGSLILLLLLVNSNWSLDKPPSAVGIAFKANEIVPDVVSNAPKDFIKVKYANKVQVILGNMLNASEVAAQPAVSWLANPCELYTFAMVDPDATSRQNPNISEFKHWLVGNIPADRIRSGEVLASYYPPAPPAGTGAHRYVQLVYRQKQRIFFDEPKTLQLTYQYRTKFSIREFAKKYKLIGPIAGNFFFSETPANNTCS